MQISSSVFLRATTSFQIYRHSYLIILNLKIMLYIAFIEANISLVFLICAWFICNSFKKLLSKND